MKKVLLCLALGAGLCGAGFLGATESVAAGPPAPVIAPAPGPAPGPSPMPTWSLTPAFGAGGLVSPGVDYGFSSPLLGISTAFDWRFDKSASLGLRLGLAGIFGGLSFGFIPLPQLAVTPIWHLGGDWRFGLDLGLMPGFSLGFGPHTFILTGLPWGHGAFVQLQYGARFDF